MSEKIKEVNKFQDTMYAQSLSGETVNISYLGYLVQGCQKEPPAAVLRRLPGFYATATSKE